MLEVVPNPFNDPIKKIIQDLKDTKWKVPFILPLLHALISVVLLFLLLFLYITIGFVSQVSNSFWDVVSGQGQKMSFSNPLPSFYYAISATVFFIIFFPFFILQSPFWFSGYLTSKIGFKPFLIMLIAILLFFGIFHFQPEFAESTLSKITEYSSSLKTHFFPPDTLNIQIEQSAVINLGQ